MSDAISIDELLGSLGYRTDEARTRARSLLERHGLTRPHKTNIHRRKVQAVKTTLKKQLALSCGNSSCSERLATTGRQVVVGANGTCEVCDGREANRQLQQLAQALEHAGVGSLLVVGGSPNASRELRDGFAGSRVALTMADGTKRVSLSRAKQLVNAVDLVVIWAPTLLCHAVSNNFRAVTPGARLVWITRRGVAALAQDLVGHIERSAA